MSPELRYWQKHSLLSNPGGHKCWLSAIDKQRSSQGALALDDVFSCGVTERNQTYLQKEDTGTGAALKPWTARCTLSGNIRRPFGFDGSKHDGELQTSRFFDRKDYGQDARAKVDYRSPTCSTLPRGKRSPSSLRAAALHDPPHAARLRAPHKLHVNGLDHPDAFSYNASELLSIGLNYKNEQLDATPSAIGQYKLFRPRVVNQASFHAMGAAVCYLNCGEKARVRLTRVWWTCTPWRRTSSTRRCTRARRACSPRRRANRTGVLLPARLLRSFLTLTCTITWRRARTSYRRSCSRLRGQIKRRLSSNQTKGVHLWSLWQGETSEIDLLFSTDCILHFF